MFRYRNFLGEMGAGTVVGLGPWEHRLYIRKPLRENIIGNGRSSVGENHRFLGTSSLFSLSPSFLQLLHTSRVSLCSSHHSRNNLTHDQHHVTLSIHTYTHTHPHVTHSLHPPLPIFFSQTDSSTPSSPTSHFSQSSFTPYPLCRP